MLSPRTVIGCAMVLGMALPASAQRAPHALHEPRFGGAFAPVAADTLHIEAVWSEQRRLRLFVSDATGDPLPLDRLRQIDGSVMVGDRESPLQLLEVSGFFEARIATLSLPALVTVRLKPSPGAGDERVTFTFTNYSADVMGYRLSSPPEIPATLPGILDALTRDRAAAEALLDQGEYAALADPEDSIRERVLAIGPYVARLALADREPIEIAITSVVRACWLLHTALDYGNVEQRKAAFTQLRDALDRISTLAAGIPQ